MEEIEEKEIKIETKDVLDEVSEGAEHYCEMTESFIKDFYFFDKTLYEWSKFLDIVVPKAKDLDENLFREMLLSHLEKLQIVNNYYAVAMSIADAIDGGNSIKKADLTNIIVDRFMKKGARRPGATILEKMVESYMSETISARAAARIVKNFWKQKLELMLEIRKILEQIGMSLHVELKFTSQ